MTIFYNCYFKRHNNDAKTTYVKENKNKISEQNKSFKKISIFKLLSYINCDKI
jgi:hypothetical protein